MNCLTLFLIAALAADAKSEPLEISSAVIKVAEEVAVPAGEPGVLLRLDAKEGQLVALGDLLAQVFDGDLRLAVDRAKLEAEIATRKMNNDVNVRFAKKSIEVARAELARSLETNQKYPKTVSETELDRQRLLVERGDLEVKQAEHDQEIAALEREVRDNELQAAQEQLARRTITAPLAGMVVEVFRRRGEWVQPGETVARIVRMDKLRAEGFLAAKHARLDLVGSKVKVKIVPANGKDQEFQGQIVFVSPEIDPINSQVRVWAEVENSELKLRPGMTATLTIEPR
jgi:macrolide-specific efflux system membrane fusion protein